MQSALPSLVDFIAIDNISKGFYTPEEWSKSGWGKGEVAAKHVQDWINAAGIKGLTSEIIQYREENLTPIIYV